jgi:hypothetical protein
MFPKTSNHAFERHCLATSGCLSLVPIPLTGGNDLRVNAGLAFIAQIGLRLNPLLPLRLASGYVLLLLCPMFANAQCGVNTIGFGDVGLVSGNPFHAESVVTRSGPTAPRGTLTMHQPELVARDSEGRVRTERVPGEFKRDNGPDAGTKAEEHIIMICDPVAPTLTQIDTLNATAKIIDSRPSAPSSSRVETGARRSFCSTRMLPSHDPWLKEEDLGSQITAGVEAHVDNTMDRWCPYELSSLVLTVTMNAKTGAQSSVAMEKIERTEPDPSLFQIPPDYAVSESVAEPHERPNRSTAQPSANDKP